MSAVQTSTDASFDFVRALAQELSSGKVDLPSFPEVAVRVRRILSDPNSTVEQVVRAVGSEPALAARLLRIANSASFNRSGRAVTDLKNAISRIGYNMVRSASIAFAMAQIRQSNKLAGLEDHLSDLWKRSTAVAAFSYVLARTFTKVNPDEAMLTGMLHGLGKLYVLTRAVNHPDLFANPEMLHAIIRDWHASIAKAILENWDFSENMAEAVGLQDDYEREASTDPSQPVAPDLRDVIAVAIVMASFPPDEPALIAALQAVPAAGRMGLTAQNTPEVMQRSAAEIAAIGEALGA